MPQFIITRNFPRPGQIHVLLVLLAVEAVHVAVVGPMKGGGSRLTTDLEQKKEEIIFEHFGIKYTSYSEILA